MFSTHLLTVLIICVITQVEQRKGEKFEAAERNRGLHNSSDARKQ